MVCKQGSPNYISSFVCSGLIDFYTCRIVSLHSVLIHWFVNATIMPTVFQVLCYLLGILKWRDYTAPLFEQLPFKSEKCVSAWRHSNTTSVVKEVLTCYCESTEENFSVVKSWKSSQRRWSRCCLWRTVWVSFDRQWRIDIRNNIAEGLEIQESKAY